MSEKDNIERLMKDKNVEFRDFRITDIRTRKREDGTEEYIIEGTPCVFNEETVLYQGKYYELREKIDAHAFDEADMSDVIFNFNHCGRVYARTRNGSLALTVDGNGLHMTATLMSGDNGHAELYRDIKSGLIDKMSFAFVSANEDKYEYIERSEGPNVEIRTVMKIKKLYDVSAVDIPAYDATSVSARNAFNAARERRIAESKNTESEKRAELKAKLELKLKLGGI